MQYEKIYVGMIMYTNTDGISNPIELEWTNGGRYSISKVIDKRYAPPAHVGSSPTLRYTVMIHGHEKILYYEKFHNKWFVEKQI